MLGTNPHDVGYNLLQSVTIAEPAVIKTERVLAQSGSLPAAELALYTDPSGGMALLAIDKDEDLVYVATVNLQPYGSRPLRENEVWLKGWGENDGVPAVLVKSEVVTLTGETMQAGHATAQLAVVDADLVALWKEHRRDRELSSDRGR